MRLEIYSKMIEEFIHPPISKCIPHGYSMAAKNQQKVLIKQKTLENIALIRFEEEINEVLDKLERSNQVQYRTYL